eukprot:scaffold11058_cov118-Skeletonema_dohrnii-CCMP3373.AAC.3
MASTSCSSVHAFASHNSLLNNNRPLHYDSGSSRLDTFLAYTSTPFDVGNNNDLWQLLEELRNKNDNSSSSDEAFHRAIDSLYRESQFNIHNLEKEIEVLRQKLDEPTTANGGNNGSSFSFQESFQTTTQDDDDNSKYNRSSSNMDVDEISDKLLKAVFVGYQWTEDDKKRLSSANPQDYQR